MFIIYPVDNSKNMLEEGIFFDSWQCEGFIYTLKHGQKNLWFSGKKYEKVWRLWDQLSDCRDKKKILLSPIGLRVAKTNCSLWCVIKNEKLVSDQNFTFLSENVLVETDIFELLTFLFLPEGQQAFLLRTKFFLLFWREGWSSDRTIEQFI